MLYPTINQYVDTLSDAKSFSQSLGDVVFCSTINGEPIFDSGNFGVVFKMRLRDEVIALKCFTRQQAGRREAYGRMCAELPICEYLLRLSWLPDELLVAPYGTYLLRPFDVVSMEYVEGQTLGEAVIDSAKRGDRLRLADLSKKFDRLALWLLEQNFAHGDIKPENIMVTPDQHLRLVDYDGVYLPSMRGELQREVGTDAYQHPLRCAMEFSKAIDDYPLALLCLSLRALAVDPSLYGRGVGGRGELLIYAPDAVDGNSSILDQIAMSGTVDDSLIECVRSTRPQIESLSMIIARDSPKVIKTSALRPIRRSKGWGFVDLQGEVIVSPFYDEVREYIDRLAAVCLNGKWGFIDQLGGVVVALRYDRVWDFTVEGFALVRLDSKYGFVNRVGRVAIRPQFDYAASFNEGLAVAAIDGRYGYIDQKGRWVIEPQYDFARSFRCAVAEVECGGRRYRISKDNTEVV